MCGPGCFWDNWGVHEYQQEDISGVIEAGDLNVDVLSVGTRQHGCERGGNSREAACGSGRVAEGLVEVL